MRRIAILCLLVLAGCSSARIAQEPRPDALLMVVYTGDGPAVLLMLDGFPAGTLPHGRVTRFGLAPGEHTFWAKSEGLFGETSTLRLAPGETAYFAYAPEHRSFERLDLQQFERVARGAEP